MALSFNIFFINEKSSGNIIMVTPTESNSQKQFHRTIFTEPKGVVSDTFTDGMSGA